MKKTGSAGAADREASVSHKEHRETFALAEDSLTFQHVLKNHKGIIGWSFFWAMCAIGWGFDAQINGAVIAIPAFRREYGYVTDDGEAILPANWQSAFNVASSIGQFFGGFFCSWMADRAGRKRALLCGSILCMGGTFGEIFSHARGAFLASKMILGVGLGFYLTLGPLVCSEITPVVLRGLSTAGVNLGICVGQLLSNAVVKGFGERADRWAFAGPFAMQLFFSVVLLAGVPFAPESPWYLVRRNQLDRARKSLHTLWGADFEVSNLLATIQLSCEESAQQAKASYIDCFRGTNLLRSAISCGGFVCQHLVGIIFVLGYSTYFFELAGLETSHSFDLGVGVTACGVFGNFLSWFIVNSFIGRRRLFLSGMVALTAILLLIGIMDVIPSSAAKWVQASLTVIYAFVYFMTVGAISFVLLGEVSTPLLRAKTTALATAVQAVFGIAMNVAVPYMVTPDEANMKGKVGFVFGGCAAVATIASWVYVPELKGRTFEEIDLLFASRVPPRHMGSYQLG
ncbi:general substrate transporter [Aspergillus pseudoustus]|uniref:General substrate transporter n=1 Tax=Aspergillus pseudoustus TaxID=1810923 RepID=A0ABR4IIS3_9EURO